MSPGSVGNQYERQMPLSFRDLFLTIARYMASGCVSGKSNTWPSISIWNHSYRTILLGYLASIHIGLWNIARTRALTDPSSIQFAAAISTRIANEVLPKFALDH